MARAPNLVEFVDFPPDNQRSDSLVSGSSRRDWSVRQHPPGSGEDSDLRSLQALDCRGEARDGPTLARQLSRFGVLEGDRTMWFEG